jgi:arylsulfatase A
MNFSKENQSIPIKLLILEKMTPIKSLIVSPLLLLSSLSSDGSENLKQNNTRPNIVLIMADDMGYECLGTYGSTSYSTPNLDRIASNGVKFSHCYSQPLCTPSRVKIMTGKYNFRNYEAFGYLNPNQKTFGNLMQEAGYETCIAGKWQLNGFSGSKTPKPGWDDNNRPHQFGFDEYCLWQLSHKVNDGSGIKKERYANPFIEQNGEIVDHTSESYGPDIFCNFITDFMERKKDKPFFVYFPMALVHDPFVPTPDSPQWKDKAEHNKNQPAHFPDMVHYTDKLVGKIVDKLKELDLEENTIIIFTGDNGTDKKIISQTAERTIKGRKGTLTDGGTRVPLLVKWPARGLAGEVSEELITFADFYASLADVLGQDEHSDGRSFIPLVTGDPYESRENIVVHYDPMWGSQSKNRGRFVRNQRYKLYHDSRFYDILSDPEELTPLNIETCDDVVKSVWKQLKTRHDQLPEWR